MSDNTLQLIDFMDVLIVCEESQAVCIEMRKRGHNAFSNDLLDCSGGHPEWHLKMDAFDAIKLQKWDLIIMHPPCTAIAVSGNRWYGVGMPRHQERIEAVKWTQKLWDLAVGFCDLVAMENPVGVLNKMGSFPKPAYIQPWQFGHGETKRTGFWLHGLLPLKPTNIVDGREQKVWKMPPSKDRGVLRSKTYKGVAEAIADQWAGTHNAIPEASNMYNMILEIKDSLEDKSQLSIWEDALLKSADKIIEKVNNKS